MKKYLLTVLALGVIGGCSPTVKLEAPKEPIEINLNVRSNTKYAYKSIKNSKACSTKTANYSEVTVMKRILTAILLVLAMQTAWAIDLDDAKAQGLVGEARTGYLAAVQKPASAEVKALIADVNAKRKAQFEKTAAKTGTTVLQVSYRFYELAVQKTEPGHYIQDADGRWKKK
jgi:hypothetical protein